MKRIKSNLIYIIGLLLFLPCLAFSQIKDFPILKGPYLGQKLPNDTAIVFSPDIVSTNQHEHSRILFSKNGFDIFWVIMPVNSNYKTTGGSPYKRDEQNIWHSKLINDEWTKPAIFEITELSGGSSPVFSANYTVFYFRTPKPDTDSNTGPKMSQLWKVSYETGQWGKPVHENNLLPNQEGKAFMSFCFADNGNLYFDYGGPDESGEWFWDIYFSEYHNGEHLTPIKMN
ncbi:hypothetical protein ACFLRG_03125, partial [Bacteroidota bacterium]